MEVMSGWLSSVPAMVPWETGKSRHVGMIPCLSLTSYVTGACCFLSLGSVPFSVTQGGWISLFHSTNTSGVSTRSQVLF